MTYDNRSIVTSITRASSEEPVTRGELAANISEGLAEIGKAFANAGQAWVDSEGQDVRPLLVFAVSLANHIVVQSVPLLQALAEHDANEDRLDVMVEALNVTIPDSVPVE